MNQVLPDQAFYEPTEEALDFLIEHLSGPGMVVEAGCGRGDLCAALHERGMSGIVGIDLHMRETQSFPVLHMDASEFPYRPHTKLIVARPNRGDWYCDVVEEAQRQGAAELIYIGIAKHIEEDIDMLVEELDLPAADLLMEHAGKDDEQIWSISLGAVMEKTKYYLIQWEHGNVPGLMMGPGWYEKKDGWWINTSGGRMDIKGDEEVLKTMEVEDIFELDWEPVLIKPGAGAGWLGRNAEWFECETKDHDDVAELVIRKSVRDLEKTGWVRVDWSAETVRRVPEQGCGWRLSYDFKGRLSVDQRNWLQMKGYVVKDDD